MAGSSRVVGLFVSFDLVVGLDHTPIRVSWACAVPLSAISEPKRATVLLSESFLVKVAQSLLTNENANLN